MAHFKATHFDILGTIINRVGEHALLDDNMDAQKALNAIVDQFVIEFTIDNPRFNESMFRKICGDAINKDVLILPSTTTKVIYHD